MDGDEKEIGGEYEVQLPDIKPLHKGRSGVLDPGTPLPNDVVTPFQTLAADNSTGFKMSELGITFGADADHGRPLREKIAESDWSPEVEEFTRVKAVRFDGGPFDGIVRAFNSFELMTNESGLLYFPREVRGEIEQCVYRIVLKEREKPLLAAEASDEEKAAHRALPREWDWVGDYVGKRKCPVPMVNGIRKVSPQAGA
jgi:hypothetical protein